MFPARKQVLVGMLLCVEYIANIHLVATSSGGAKEDKNCVACCKTLNAALGNFPIKSKLLAVLNQRAKFTCPRSGAQPGVQPLAPI